MATINNNDNNNNSSNNSAFSLPVLVEDVDSQIQDPIQDQDQYQVPSHVPNQEQEQEQEQEQDLAVKDTVLADTVVLAVKDMHVTIVQDDSGSMHDQRRSVLTGINEIIGEMKNRYQLPCPYTATFRFIRFSSHDCIHIGAAVPVHDVKPMTPADLKCDGMTALWDAAAAAINLMNAEHAGVSATTYIFTDGDNNDSKECTQSGVNEMIADNKKRNPMHSVLFIGSDASARRNASAIGLDRVHSIQHDAENTPNVYYACRRALGRCISGDTQSTQFNDDDIILSETPSEAPHHQQQQQQHPQPPHSQPFSDSQIYDQEPVTDQEPSDIPFYDDQVPTVIRCMSSGSR